MSIERRIESAVGSMVPFLMNSYVYLWELFGKTVNQFGSIVHAVRSTFKDQLITFLTYGDTYVPFVHTIDEMPIVYGERGWTYYVNRNVFYNAATGADVSPHRLPFLGATLKIIDEEHPWDTPYEVGDMSEWVAEQSVYSSNEFVPIQVLVCAWAYITGNTLRADFEGLVMTIMDMSGDERHYRVSNGEELIAPSTAAADEISPLEKPLPPSPVDATESGAETATSDTTVTAEEKEEGEISDDDTVVNEASSKDD